MLDDSQVRSAFLLRSLSPGPAVVRVDGRGKRVYYLFCERTVDAKAVEPGNRVFSVARLGAATAYVTCVGTVPGCECMGFLARSTCVHTGLIASLLRSGQIS